MHTIHEPQPAQAMRRPFDPLTVAHLLGALLLIVPVAALPAQAQTTFGPQQIISTQASGAHSVYTADLDGDGDLDVLSASSIDGKIAWYENNGTGGFGSQQIISTEARVARSVYAADLDGDDDLDVLSASSFDDKIAWYENDGQAGPSFTEHVISTGADAATSVYAADLDGDGDLDVLSASSFDNKIAWYENRGPNQPPTITSISVPTAPVALTENPLVSASFSDPDQGDTHTCTIDYGDGSDPETGSVTGAAPEYTCTGATHSYSQAGVYTVSVSVSDGTETATATADDYLVVYDPSAGFVTGAGWIDSPAGAYAADPDLTGKAHFGFVSRYKKGQSTPEGSTQFEFTAGALTFASASYEWLIVAGAHAQFKGSGTIGGAGDYGFLLWASDGALLGSGGGADLFRIKIWDKSAGDAIVYDNQLGEAEDAGAGTALGGGSIVIHSGKGKAGKTAEAEASLEGQAQVPSQFALEANYPNPFNPETEIGFALPEAVHVRLVVYDVLGREVARLLDGPLAAGQHAVRFEAGHLPSGTYLYRIEAGRFSQSRRMLLMK